MRGLAVTVGVVVLLLGLVVGLLWGFQRKLIYLPDDGPVGAADAAVPGARDVVLRTADGLELGAWYVPGGAPDAATVLVANGNGGHRGGRAPLARALSDVGLGVLLFDYRGYGGNPGSPSEDGLALDVRAARDHLVDEVGVRPDRLLYLGESLGAAVVTELASEHPPAGLILRSPFVDLASVAAVHYPFLPVRALLRDRFPRGGADRARRRPDDGRLRQRRLDRAAGAEPGGGGRGGAVAPARGSAGSRPQRSGPARRRRAGHGGPRAGVTSHPFSSRRSGSVFVRHRPVADQRILMR